MEEGFDNKIINFYVQNNEHITMLYSHYRKAIICSYYTRGCDKNE